MRLTQEHLRFVLSPPSNEWPETRLDFHTLGRGQSKLLAGHIVHPDIGRSGGHTVQLVLSDLRVYAVSDVGLLKHESI